MSTSAPSIGLPVVSRNQASTNSTGPGVGERMIVSPFLVGGEFNAPERSEQIGVGLGLAAIAVVEQADQRREAERARHQHRFVVGLVGLLAERDDVGRWRPGIPLRSASPRGRIRAGDERTPP